MNYYLHTKVWINELDEDGQKMADLGIDREGKLVREDMVLDIMRIVYFYPTTMKDKGDSTYVRLRGKDSMVVAVPFAKFNEQFRDIVDSF